MSNPPAITVPPGPGMAFGVQVFVNGIDPVTGLPAPVLDTTSPLVFEDLQGGTMISHTVDPANNRRIIVKSLAPSSANGDQPFSFRVKSAAVTSSNIVLVSGTAVRNPDFSSVTWDGVAPSPA